jgi:hypothetical protein
MVWVKRRVEPLVDSRQVRRGYIHDLLLNLVEVSMRSFPVVSMLVAVPALIQAHMMELESTRHLPIEDEARDFMAGYADDLRAGRRQAIVNRYDKRGAFRVGEGEKLLESLEMIRAAYLTQWTPPKFFEWRNLSFEPLSSDAVLVIGLFDWGTGNGRSASFSYTALLNRQDGSLKIRLEDESMERRLTPT